jgi:anti-sigma regulatory factor (Ser/Thr protein kinase)
MENRCEYSTLTVPNDRGYAAVAAAYVEEVAKKIGFEDKDRDSIGQAVSEILTAILRHAFEPSERASLEVSCERVPAGLKVTIRDQGLPFEPRPITECEFDGGSSDARGTVEPMCVAKGYVDDVEFHNLGAQGKETVLIKFLKNRHITDYYEACELEPYESHDTGSPRSGKPIQVDVRLMKPSEAIEVSRCVYRSYGYSYFYEHLYFPERIVELNQSGALLSAVAVTPTDEIAGHAGFIRPDPPCRTGELGIAVVKPEFRSQGILNRITEYVLDQVRSEGFVGVFGRAVTNHTYSQRVGLRIGERDCGLQVGFFPATTSFKGITEKLSQRESAIVHFLYLDKPPRVQLCLPAHHRDMIVKLYRNIGISSELEERECSGAPYQPGESSVTTAASTRTSFARIQVTRYGRNVVSEVRSRLKEFCLTRFDVIHLYLDLHDPCTCRFTEAFEELGFFFSGILPGVFPGDALILQYLNNVPIDYEKIRIHAREGRELLEYVTQRDPSQ